MIRELRNMDRECNPTDPYEWAHAPEGLWFFARDKVIGALKRRGLIDDYNCLTAEGKAALAELSAKGQ